MKTDYFVEMTDTFGGESNYSWIRRFRVKGATTNRGAMRKVGIREGYGWRKSWDDGTVTRYDAKGAAVCFFVEEWTEELEKQYPNIAVLG